MARITDDDLKIRHTTVDLLLVALGYVSGDSSKGTIMEVQKRVNKAVERGDFVINSTGYYRITAKLYHQQLSRNYAQTRRKRAA
jgi:hypothetical protein